MQYYREFEINGVMFERVQLFIWKFKIELVDCWGRVVAVIDKEDIKTVGCTC